MTVSESAHRIVLETVDESAEAKTLSTRVIDPKDYFERKRIPGFRIYLPKEASWLVDDYAVG